MLSGLHRAWRSERRRERLGTNGHSHHPNLPTGGDSTEAKLSLSRRTVASLHRLQSEGKHDEYGGSRTSWPRVGLALSAAALGTLIAPRCHYRRATVVSPPHCPRLPRAARRRTCTEESVLWIGPVAKGSHVQRLLLSADDMSRPQLFDVLRLPAS
jgi:hypothetical protein